MSEFDDFAARLGTSSDASLQQSSPLSEDTQLSADQERIKRRTEAFNDIALQATRDSLGKVSNPIERKRLDAYYSLEQKQKLLEGNTIDKYHGLDGFQKMRIRKASDGDSGWIEDKDGNRYEFRLNSSSSTNIDTPDLLRSVQASSYKSRIQPEAVARASGKSVDQLTEFDYANYDHYAQNEFIKRITSKEGYRSERYDPSKVYSPVNADGLEVYARFEGEDSTSSKRKLTTILNPYTGENVGYNSSLDPNVNADFSLFRSLRNRSNAQKALAAQRRGEYYRDTEMPENGYVDPNASMKRYYEEYGDRTPLDSFVGGYARQLGSAALSSAGNIAVALNDTLGGSEESKGIFDLRRFADKDVANIAVGMRKERRDTYNKYIQNVSSKFEEGDIAGGLWEFIKNPAQVSMFVGEQLGNMAPGLIATAATGGAGAASFGAATATDLLANIGMDFMEFRKNHGRSMNAEEMAKAYIRQLPAAALDALSDKILVGNTNLLKTARYTPLRAVGQVTKEMGVEGTQEVTQNIASLMNSEDKSFDEALKDPSNISNFMLGAIGGGLMSAPVGTGQITKHMIKSAAFQQFKEKYEAKFDQQAADAGDTLATDHRQQRESFITSTLDNYQQAKDANDSTGMFKSITALNAKLKDTQSGLSAYDKEHIKSTLYDVVNDTIANLVKDGAMNPATESVLNQLKDSLGIQDNEQLKKDLAKYAEVYGSAANGRLATQNDTYENDHDRQVKAEQFETLIENLGGTKAEARKLLEEVAEENITSKTEGFDSYLAAAKKAKEEGDTHTFDGKVEDMSNRVESMAIKHAELINGLKDEMNKGAAVDSKGMLSNDKIHIKYGNEKDSARRGEKASFDTSFKQEAFNYSTRGGIYRTADQISSEVQYMAEQLNNLEGVPQEVKDKVNAFVSQVKQNDDLLEHLGYELHRGIKGGTKFNAEQESDVELSNERHAEIKEAMESYFNQYVAPRSASEKLTAKEAYQLKKYTSGLSLSELKSFQKSLDPKKDSIAYEGVSAVIKNRERNIGIASSHDAWLKNNKNKEGKYQPAAVQETQSQAQSKPQVKPQEKPSTARDLKVTKDKIDKATDVDELIESGAYIDNLIATVSDPSHKDYKNKPLMRKLKSIKKAIAERIAKLKAQNASNTHEDGSESTETGQDIQSTMETAEGSQNGSEGSETVSEENALANKSLDDLKTKYSIALNKAGLEKEQVNAVVEVLINNAKILADAFGMSVEDYLNTRFAGFQSMSQKEFEEKYSDALYQDAWHGSPHKFDKFSLESIGSGEGLQFHGWGLYFGREKEIADDYRWKLSMLHGFTYDGKKLYGSEMHKLLADFIHSGTEYESDTALREGLQQFIDRRIKQNKELIKKHELTLSILRSRAFSPEKIEKIYATIKKKGRKFRNRKFKDAIMRLYVDFNIDGKDGGRVQQEIQNDIKYQEDIIKEYQNVEVNKLSYKNDNGQLFKVDIPNDEVLINENKLFKDQSEIVQNAALSLIPNLTREEAINNHLTGNDLYVKVKNLLGSPKEASLAFNNLGVKGIVYNEQRENDGFVIFDDKAVKVLEKYYQRKEGQEAKGATTISANQSLITLFEKGDVSTALHETSHFFLNEVRELIKSGKAPKWMQDVWNTLQNQYNFNSLLDGTDSKSVKNWTRVQERFARDFEAYMREGKAPKPELQDIFDACRKWLKAIYKTIRSLLGRNKLSPEIRQAFDALFTGEFKRDENITVQSEVDNSEELNTEAVEMYAIEDAVSKAIEQYSTFIDPSMSSKEANDIALKLQEIIDQAIRFPNSPYIAENLATLQNILGDYKRQYEEALNKETAKFNEEAIESTSSSDEVEALITCNNVLNAYKNIDSNLSSDELYSIADKISEAIIKYNKFKNKELQDLVQKLRELYDAYNAAIDEIWLNENAHSINSDEDMSSEDETLEQLKERLINVRRKKTKEEKKAEGPVNPMGDVILAQWRGVRIGNQLTGKPATKRDNLLKVFAENEHIKRLSSYFRTKVASMTLNAEDGRSEAGLNRLIDKAVELLSGAVMQLEEIPEYTSRDKKQGKPNPQTLGTVNGKKEFKLLYSWNGVLSNMFNNNPHLQLLFAPKKITGNLHPKNGKPFANVYSAEMSKPVAAALLLAMSELFANRTVSVMFNPQSRDEIAASFGTTAEAADPMQLDMYSKVVNRWGVFKNNICSTLGKLAMDNLGLARSPELAKKLFGTYENAEAALGNLALVMAQQLGLLKVTDVYVGPEPTLETSRDKEAYNKEKATYDRCAKLEELGIGKDEAAKLGLGTAKIRHFYKFIDTKENAELIKDLWLGPQIGLDENGAPIVSGNKIERDESLGFKQFKTGVDTLTRTPKLDPKDVHNKAGRRKQEEFKLTPERMDVLNEESQAPYYINLNILDKLLSFCDNDMTKLKAALLKKMGYNDIITNKKKFKQLSYDEQQKIKGKNENVLRELDYLLAYAKLQRLLEEKGEFKGYFFEYFGSANGRSFMDTNTVNPQTAKSFTRFLMQPLTTKQEYDLNNREDIEKELFAVAQAFDCLKKYYSTDEYKNHNGASLAGKLLGLDVINKGTSAIEERLAELKELQEDLLLSNDSTNEKVYKNFGWDGKVENFGQACVAIDHCVRRLEAILNNNGSTEGAVIDSYLAVENDSTTSGYVIKFMLMPLDEKLLMDYGPKVGFLNHALIDANNNFSSDFKDRLKKYTSIDQLKADPEFLDIYKTAAVEMISEFEIIENEIENKNITIGDLVVEKACQRKDDDGEVMLTRLGSHLENSGMDASSITKGFNIVSAAIPHPEKDSKTGFWKVSSILRNLMKPIVMIFGYNASNDSCRKRFAEAVMEEHIKDFLKLWHSEAVAKIKPGKNRAGDAYLTENGKKMLAKDPNKATEEDIKRAEAIFNFMTGAAIRVTGITNNKYQALKEFAEQLSEKSPYAVRFLPAKEGVLTNETLSLAEWYQLVIGNTYGQAITNFLSKRFKAYGDANKALNNVSKIVFKLYSHVRNQLIRRELSKLAELDDSSPNKAPTESRVQSLRSKYADKLRTKEGEAYKKLTADMLNMTDLTVTELKEIDEKVKPLFPMFPVAGLDPKWENKEQYYIRSVETTSADLTGAAAYTEMWRKGSDGKFMPGFPAISEGSQYRKLDPEYDNSYGDITEFSEGQRILAVLLIHFFDGLLAQNTMSPMLREKVKKYLTVVHDAFVASAKDSGAIGRVFNEELFELTKNFNPFMEINKILGRVDYYGRETGLVAKANEICRNEKLEPFDFNSPLKPTQPKITFNNLVKTMYGLGMKTNELKRKIFSLANPDGTENKIVVANLGGDLDSGYNVSEQVHAPVSNVRMSTPTVEEKASIQEGDALGSKAAAWKDGYAIEKIEKDANATAEGRDRLVNDLNEYDELEGPVKNTPEFVEHVKSFLSLLNPERLRELSLELAKSKKDATTKGVYFTGQGQSGNRRITVIKAKDVANEADRQRRLASRQVSAVSVYGHEVIHAAISEPLANAEIYGVTRERSALQKFQNAVADKLHELHGEHPENFFRPDNYDSLTDAEKALADQSALEFYNYMFNNADKDTIGGLQEFIAYATTDPRMIELLKSMDASQYSAEYKGKNLFEKLCYIVKHIIKAAFGNLESRQKVINTYTSLGNNPKKAANMHEAIEELLVKLSYANKDAASKLGNGKLSQFEHMFEALSSAAQLVKPVNDYLSNKIKWVFDLGGVANRFERTYKSFEQIIREHGITENSGKMDTLKTLLLCPFSHNMRVALIDTLIGCCEQGQRSTFAHLIRDVSDKDDATAKIEALSAQQNLIDQTSRNAGAATSMYIQEQFGGKLTDAEAVAGTKIGLGCDLQCLFFNGYSIADIKKLAAGEGIEEAIAKHEDAIKQFYANDKDGKMKATWTRNQCLGLAHFMNTNKGNPALCLNARNIAKGILCSKKNAEVNEDLVNHIDCLATLYALANAEPEHRLALSIMKPEGLKAILQCHRNLIDNTRKGEYIEEAHVIKGWHASIIDDTRAYAVAPVDPDTIKAMENDGYVLYENKALPVDNMTDAVMGFYIKDANTPQHRQGAALQITSKRAIGQSLNSFMEANEHIIGDRKDYIRKQTKKAFAFKDRMQAKMESLTDLKYEDFDTRKLIGSYYTPVINPKGDVVDFRITMFNDFKDVAMHRNNNVCDVLSKMEATNVVKSSAGTHNSKIVHFLVDDMERNMDPDTHRLKHQYENFGEVALGSRDLRHRHDIKYVKLQLDPESEFVAPDIPAAILPSEMKMAMKKLEQKGDGLWVREDWLYQIFGTPEMSLADFDVMQKENMRAARNGIRVAENVIKGIATLAKVAIVFKKPAVIVGNCVSNYMFHLMNGHNPVTAAAMDTENLQLLTRYMQFQKEVNLLDLKKDIGEATDYEKAKLTRYRAEMENSPVHELVQEGLFSAIVEDNSKKDQDSIKFMIRKIKENPIMQKAIKTKFGDTVNMDTLLGQATGQIWMREGTPIYDFIYTMTQYSDFVSRLTDYRIGMENMRKNKTIAGNPVMAARYRELLIQQIRDDYINYDIPQSKLMNYVNAMGITFFTKYFFRIQRVIRRIATRRPLMTFAMMAGKAHFDLPDNIFNQAVTSKHYSVIPRGLFENIEEAAKPQLFEIIDHPFSWLNAF